MALLNFRVTGEIVGVVGKKWLYGKSTLADLMWLAKDSVEKFYTKTVWSQVTDFGSGKRILSCRTRIINCLPIAFTRNCCWHYLTKRIKTKKRIDDILDELNLTIYKEQHPMSLSGGQKQRTAIGVAALRDAEVLIFDEPTSGLNTKTGECCRNFDALSKRGESHLGDFP